MQRRDAGQILNGLLQAFIAAGPDPGDRRRHGDPGLDALPLKLPTIGMEYAHTGERNGNRPRQEGVGDVSIRAA